MAISWVLFALTTGFGLSHAVNLTTSGCADSNGLQSCLDKSATASDTCIDHARADNSELEALACGCTLYTDNINCYASHCWNRVYECEYQEYVLEYLKNCLASKLPVPYFPAPDDAKDACSCNLGKVYLAIAGTTDEGNSCMTGKSDGDDALGTLNKIQGCKCCEISGSLSSIYDICPNTDPKHAGIEYVSQLEELLQTPFTACGSVMDQYDCQADLSFSSASTYYEPDNVPSSGTATLSDGPGTVTSPASGSVFTYTNAADSQVYTISAAEFERGDGDESGSTSKATENGSSSSSPTETASETGASSSDSADDDEGAASSLSVSLVASFVALGAFAMARGS